MGKLVPKRPLLLVATAALLIVVGWGPRVARREAPGDLVGHGPFLVPRTVLRPGIAHGISRPPGAARQFITHNSAFIIRPSLAFAFSKSNITGAETITTVAGTGARGFSGDGGPVTSARLNSPSGVSIDRSGNLFIVDMGNQRIRKAAMETGIITTVAGTGAPGFSGDGGPATSAQINLRFLVGVAVDASGNLYIADRLNHRIRRVDPTGIITTVAGSGPTGLGMGGFSGDGGPATSAQLHEPETVAVDGNGQLFIADANNARIRKVVLATGLITTVAGGSAGLTGDGVPATNALLAFPPGVAVDGAGNLFVADQVDHRIRKVILATGLITTVAGTGTAGFSGDGGPATGAQLNEPLSLAVDGSGNLFIVDSKNQRIRKVILATGLITTVAGTGTAGFNGDGIAATSAQLSFPLGVAVDGSGNLFIADQGNNRIRKIAAVIEPMPTVTPSPSPPAFPTASPTPAPGGAITVLAPADGAILSVISPTAFAWTAVGGAQAYLFEYTGPTLTFTNPRGTAPDPINGVPPRGASFAVSVTSFSTTISPAAPPGSYQFRVVALDAAGRFIGTFSDARTVIIPSPAPPIPAPQPTPTVTPVPTPAPTPTPVPAGGGGEGGGT